VDEHKALVHIQDILCYRDRQLSMIVRFAGQSLPASLPVALRWSAAENKFQGSAQDGWNLSIVDSVMETMCQDPQHPGRRFEGTLNYL
jgi:hypothetical protein